MGKELIGKTVYTVNNKTNDVDEWTCNAILYNELCMLHNDKGTVFLPLKCVFRYEYEARKLLEKE